MSARPVPSYGQHPWHQTQWDARAAGNFMAGGAGSGLIFFAVVAGASGLFGVLLLLAGLALVGIGLLCVWLEIGRPLRALNVFFNPKRSWMSRESLVAVLLGAATLAVVAGWAAVAPLAALAALGFVYCQARLIQAARGIPAWRETSVVPLVVATGLAEGGGLFWLAAAAQPVANTALAMLFAALVLARWLLWRAWRRRIAASAAPRALAAIDRSGQVLLWLGSVLPLALTAFAVSVAGASGPLLASAGFFAAVAGAAFKFTLITRAAFNQGFALPRLPVRGVPR
jgi:phenylacetyl-CoA:acceptor oxidoreductase subunit 2